MKVLLVEDDREILAVLRQGLEEAGFEVDSTSDGAEGLRLALRGGHDALILDIMLPGMDGLEVLSKMRKSGMDTPVLILSARRSVDDRVLGLQSGGDDYLVKPFAFAELLARLQSLIRRSRGAREPVQLKIENLRVDLLARKVYCGENQVELQPREFTLLEYLVRNKNEVVTRAQILQHVWGFDFTPSTNVVEVHVCRLREKLEKSGLSKLIRTMRGVGYMLMDAEDEKPLD